MEKKKDWFLQDEYFKSLPPKKQKKLAKKENIYLERYGVSYIELSKKSTKTEKTFDKKVMKKYWAKYKQKLIILYACLILTAVVGLAPAVIYQHYIESITANPPLWQTAIMLVVGYSVVWIFNALLMRFSQYKIRKILNLVILDLRNDLSKKIVYAKYDNYKKLNSGKIVNRISTDANMYANTMQNLIVMICQVVTSVVFLVYTLIIAPILSLIVLGLSFIGALSDYIYNKTKRKEQQKRNSAISDVRMGIYNEAIRGVYDVKLLGVESLLYDKIQKSNDQQNDGRTDALKSDRSFGTIFDFLNVLKIFFTYILAVVFLENGLISLAICIVFFSFSYHIDNFFSNIRLAFVYSVEANTYRERMCEILDDDNFKIEKFGKTKLQNVRGKVEFENVSFAYADDPENLVLQDVNLVIPSKSCVGFVGPSGAGKSTIVSLIPRIYDVTNGVIKIDGIDIKKLNKKSLRNSVAVVSQSPYIFNTTFKENLTMINPNLTDKEIENILKKVQLWDVVTSRPEGVDTRLGEGGIQLSGGQKQRLAIARALVKNSKIIIFDEATSALDNKTQQEIQEVIQKIKKDHTIIIVAHRLSTIIDCDTLYFIKDGKILAKGTHSELLKKSKEYKEMYKKEDKIES